MRTTTRLRQMLQAPGIIVAPGAYDGFSARLIEAAGFQAVYMTGAGTAASHLGQPDLGLATATEMANHAGHLASCVSLPVIADADTGYGNALNVVRTVREYEKAGVAGLHIEDQVSPKKCGHIAGKQVISRSFSGKGVDARFALVPDERQLLADGADSTRVVLRVTDTGGGSDVSAPITITVGPPPVPNDPPAPLSRGSGQIMVGANGFCVAVNTDRLLQRGIPGLREDVRDRCAEAEKAREMERKIAK